MNLDIKQEGRFKYVMQGEGPVIIFLHGLFGALSNFKENFEPFTDRFTVALPLLPLYELEVKDSTVPGMVDYIDGFIEHMGFEKVILLGNSLGGHIGLLYTLEKLEKVQGLILTGSSGLFESALGDTFPKRGDYEYIKNKTETTFYDPEMATKELVDEVFDIVNDREKVIRVLSIAKSALRHNIGERLGAITQPTILIWGNEDSITPPFVGVDFEKLIPNSKLHLIKQCGHAAMMEKPEEFNIILNEWLEQFVK